jgi:hypothetical protein
MGYIKTFILFIMIISTAGTKAQDLAGHRWKNRVVLILTDQNDNENYRNQVEELKNHLEGINERKILVYHITPDSFKTGLSDAKWQKAETNYPVYKKTDGQPEIILIGLDGGVKLRAEEFLSSQRLFATIDAMPMRRQEIKGLFPTFNLP